VGIVTIPKYVKQEKAFVICAILGLLFSSGALFTSGVASVSFIALLGLANSLMWPAIWPLALAGVGRFTKAASSLLIMGIAGGAIVPSVYGALAGYVAPHQASWVAVPCYLFLLYYALLGHKVGKARTPRQ